MEIIVYVSLVVTTFIFGGACWCGSLNPNDLNPHQAESAKE